MLLNQQADVMLPLWIGSDCISLDWIGLDQTGADWFASGQIRLDRIELGPIGLHYVEFGQKRTGSDTIGLLRQQFMHTIAEIAHARVAYALVEHGQHH